MLTLHTQAPPEIFAGTGTSRGMVAPEEATLDNKPKICGKPCPRCNDENVGYCIINEGHGSDLHSCGSCGLAY